MPQSNGYSEQAGTEPPDGHRCLSRSAMERLPIGAAGWLDALDALRRLDLHGGEHRQHPADCLAGPAAQTLRAKRFGRHGPTGPHRLSRHGG